MNIGYIGLGIMGKSIARNILKAGFPLVVHNRSRAAVQELIKEGAREAFSPAEVAAQADIVFTNLPDSPDVEKVVLGPEGIIEKARKGLVFVDNSTIKPAAARLLASRLSEKGTQALDAPVSGGDIGAREARLSIMIGGPPQAGWGYQVLMQSNEGFPDKTDLLTRKVNEYEGQHRFGGGNDGDCDPHVIDLLAGKAVGDKGEIDLQHKMLAYECNPDGTAKKLATLTMVRK